MLGSSFTRHRKAACSYLAMSLRLLLLLSAWQAPVPWCHCHGSLRSAPAGERAELAEHLKHYHAATPLLADVFFGWHFHTDLPDPASGDPAKPVNHCTATRPIVVAADDAGMIAAAMDAAQREHSVLSAECFSAASCSALSDGGCVGHFFDAYAAHLSLPLRLGVSRS